MTQNEKLDISPSIKIELLRAMKRIRAIEEAISEKYSEGKMRCPVHLCTGQEAVSSAVGICLRKNDLAVSGHRAHGHYLGKGGSLNRMMAEIFGKETGCSRGKGGSMHLVDVSAGFMGSTAIVGGTIPIGVGLAYSIKLHGTDQICCVYLGDAAVEEGVFYESANFAALKKLPVLFICENNLYSVYSSLRVRQPEGREIYKMVEAMGIPSKKIDGNNAIESYLETRESCGQIRAGGGPQFLEFSTYRWREHCGPGFDNDIGYRTEKEYLEWRAREPIAPLEAELLNAQEVTSKEILEMDQSIRDEIVQAFQFSEDSPFPAANEAFKDLYE